MVTKIMYQFPHNRGMAGCHSKKLSQDDLQLLSSWKSKRKIFIRNQSDKWNVTPLIRLGSKFFSLQHILDFSLKLVLCLCPWLVFTACLPSRRGREAIRVEISSQKHKQSTDFKEDALFNKIDSRREVKFTSLAWKVTSPAWY